MVDTVSMEKHTAQKILDVAQDMVRNRGYSAFSYADISAQVGIRKASIHYALPLKGGFGAIADSAIPRDDFSCLRSYRGI